MFDVKVLENNTAGSGSTIGAPRFNRRRALAKLGLTAAAIYVAPTLLALTPAGASEHSTASAAFDGGGDDNLLVSPA